MDLYLKVRHAHFQDGLSGRQIARDFGISRDSVAKMAYSEPPGYRRTAPGRRPKLDAFKSQIDQWLAEDKVRPRKQRHTAKRIFELLRDECSFDGGYGHRAVWIKGFVTRVVIGSSAEVIAEHPRSYDTGDMVFDPVHYLPLIERKNETLSAIGPRTMVECP